MLTDFELPLLDGTILKVRPPTLADQKRARGEVVGNGPAPGADDPRVTEIVQRLVYRCAKWNGSPQPSFDEFLERVSMADWNAKQEELADFFGRRRTASPSPPTS